MINKNKIKLVNKTTTKNKNKSTQRNIFFLETKKSFSPFDLI